MSYRCVAVALSMIVVLAGCATTTLESYKAKDSDEAVIVTVLMKIQNGVKAKSVDLIMQAYADDLYVGNFNKYIGVASENAAVRIGKSELRQAYTQVFRSVKEISMEVKDFHLIVQGDRAVAEGYTELLVKIEAGRKEARENLVRNELTWRLKRGPMGWRVQEEIFH